MSAIVIKDLTKSYRNCIAVDHLSLTIGQGELFGLLGVNGAGKTTTIKMLSCLTRPSEGTAVLMGQDICQQPEAVKRIISLSTQETAVAANLTVRENLEFIAQIYAIPNPHAAADRVIRAFSLQEKAHVRTKTLSGGWQRKVSIAMALITEPQILFLDEPTLGLDVLARRELWHLIEQLKSRMTIILTTHYLEEAEALCDRIAIMTEGKLRAVGTASELKRLAGKDCFEEAFIEIAARAGKGETA